MCRCARYFFLFCTLQTFAQIPPQGLATEVEASLQDITPLKNITAEQLSKLKIDDPLLRMAYAQLMGSLLIMQLYPPRRPIDYSAYPPWDVAALEDLKKRGDAVTPVLLDIATKNPNSGFEVGVLVHAPLVVKDLNPYLQYARNILQTRTMKMDSGVAGAVAELLIRRGTPDDVEKLRNLIRVRPYLTGTIEAQLQHAAVFQPTRNDAPDTKPRLTPSIEPPPTSKKTSEIKPSSTSPSGEPTPSAPWRIIVGLIVATGGLLWLRLKKRM